MERVKRATGVLLGLTLALTSCTPGTTSSDDVLYYALGGLGIFATYMAVSTSGDTTALGSAPSIPTSSSTYSSNSASSYNSDLVGGSDGVERELLSFGCPTLIEYGSESLFVRGDYIGFVEVSAKTVSETDYTCTVELELSYNNLINKCIMLHYNFHHGDTPLFWAAFSTVHIPPNEWREFTRAHSGEELVKTLHLDNNVLTPEQELTWSAEATVTDQSAANCR